MLVDAITAVLAFIGVLFSWLLDQAVAILTWIWTEVTALPNTLVDLMAQTSAWAAVKTLLSDTLLSNASTLMGFATWFLPVNAMLVLFVSTMTTAASIRLLRWVKAFIPAMGS